jgi:hypothetical protein
MGFSKESKINEKEARMTPEQTQMFVMADSPTQNWFITEDARSKFSGILKEYLDCEWFQIRYISFKD